MNRNLYSLLAGHFLADPAAAAIETADGRRWSYGELDAETARCANLLVSLGVRPGDRVAAQLDKSPFATFLYLGALRAGAVWLPLNTAYQQGEIGYFLEDAEPRVALCRPEAAGWFAPLAARSKVTQLLTLEAGGGGEAAAAAAAQPAGFETVIRDDGDLACIVYTSGTTGRAKGAMVTHGNLSSNATALHRSWGYLPGDVLLHALPMFHVHGLFVALHTALMNASRIIFLPKYDAAQVLSMLRRATVFMGVPTMYVRLLAEPGLDREACRTMRLFVSGSAPLLKETFEQFRARTGHAILERYGMTETGMNTSNPCAGERRAGTVGMPLPGVEVRVADAADRPLPAGEIGGIQVRGPNVMAGYWRLPEKTREEFSADGWFRTGDLGVFDADGYLSIVGRSKDLVISGGYNVYPKEVEMLLDEHPAVAESAVIGVPHPDFGEAVVAVVVAKPGAAPGEAELIDWVKSRLANYKVPKRVHLVDDLPRNAMGKVQKALLRQAYAA